MADEQNWLTDLSGIGRPVTKLIETISGAAGVLYEPNRIRRRAVANADKIRILATARADANEIEFRAAERLMAKEVRRQENIEAISRQAIKELPETVSGEPVDQDWVFQFFEHSQEIGNSQMQILWARILAGEVAAPGTFSPRTLRFIRDLTQQDAALFTDLCSFVWGDHRDGYIALIFKDDEGVVNKSGITFSVIIHLASIGLITYENDGYRLLKISSLRIPYFRKLYCIKCDSAKDLQSGNVLLTATGRELVPVAGGVPNEEYLRETIGRINKQGYEVEEIPNGQ